MSLADGPFSAEMPLGLAFGLAMDQERLDHYGKLTEYEKEKMIAESKGVKSKEEMENLIQKIGDGDTIEDTIL